MAGRELWPLIHPERHALVEDIATLSDEPWSNLLIGSKRRITGLTLRATDADWSSGSGPEVSGPAISLLLAMTGRGVAVDDLSGPGVETLRSRT